MGLLRDIVSNTLDIVATLAKKLPDNPYLHCYTITNGTTKYITRIKLPRIFGWRLMIHNIHREDHDMDMHNHPWNKAYSIILTGTYVEERLVQEFLPFVLERETRIVKWFNSLRKEDFHRIKSIDGPVWTLFIAGERQEINGVEWGFLDERERKLIPFNEYIAKTGAKIT